MKQRIGKKILMAAILLLVILGGLIGCSKMSLQFDDGDSVSMNIGEVRLLSFTAQPLLAAGSRAYLVSSDESIAAVEDGGYIRAVGEGSAVVTLTADGTTARDEITVHVVTPEIAEENRFMVMTEPERMPCLFLDVSSDIAAGTVVYGVAEKDGVRVGAATAEVLPNHRVYFQLDDLGIVGGVYGIGFGFVGNEQGKVLSVYNTDAYISRSLTEGEDWTFYNAERREDGKLSIVNDSINHGGASIVFDIQQREDGSFVNPYFRVSAQKGAVWAVKLRRGDGEDSRFEEVVLGDIAVSEESMCTFDLNDYAYYVYGGKVTLVIYAVQDDLTIGDIVNYSDRNEYVKGVGTQDYVALETVSISAPEKVRVGSTYRLTATCSPANASFQEFAWVAENERISVSDDGVIQVKEAGECEISALGFDGKKYGSVILNGTVGVEEIRFTTTAGQATVKLSDGSYDLASGVEIYPADASDKTLIYTLVSAGTGFAVDEAGKITFTEEGSAIVRVSSRDNVNAWKEFSLTVEESFTPVQTVVISNAAAEMLIGTKAQLSAQCSPGNADHAGIIWVSSDESVLTVANGEVTALRAGSAMVSAYSEDGAAYDSVEIEVLAAVEVELDPSAIGYGSFELGNEILSGDEVTIVASKGEDSTVLVRTTIAEEEKDVNGQGSMDAQRRILFDLSDKLFDEVGLYRFEVLVTRSGETLGGYTYGRLVFGKTVADITNGVWETGYQCEPSEGGGMTATLTGDGFGNVTQTVDKSAIEGARYLLVSAKTRTADKISVKIAVGETEITIATGDCTSLGVYKFDLSDAEIAKLLQNAESFEVHLYVIGKAGTSATFDTVMFVTEDAVL